MTLAAGGLRADTPATTYRELVAHRGELIDYIDFSDGEVPATTVLGRPVYEKVGNSASATIQTTIVDGAYTTTTTGLRGGAYIVADAGEGQKAYYQYSEFQIASGGTSDPDQGSVQHMPWMENMALTPSNYVPATAMHLSLAPGSYGIKAYTAANTDVTVQLGNYAQGALDYDEWHILETCLVDGSLYWFIDGTLQESISSAYFEGPLIGRYPGFEIFKNTTTDGEPSIRNLAFSTSAQLARSVRDHYLRLQTIASAAQGADKPFTIVDDYFGGLLTTGNIGAFGWSHSNGSVTAMTAQADHPGCVRFNTGTTSGQICVKYLSQATNVGKFHMQDLQGMQFVFAENVAGATNITARVGVSSDVASATPNSGFYLERLPASTTWELVGRRTEGGVTTESRLDTGVACGTTDWLTARFYRIDGVSAGVAIAVGGVATATVEMDYGDGESYPNNATVIPMYQQTLNNTTLRSLNIDLSSFSFRATER